MIISPTKDKENILNTLNIVEQYINGDKNNFDGLTNENCKNHNFQEIENKIISIAKQLEQRDKESLTVYGEIMLTCEKLSDGFTTDRITSSSNDPKLGYISKTLNDMFLKLYQIISNVKVQLKEYSDLNYIKDIDISVFRGGEFKELLEGINNLKDTLNTNLIKSHKDSLILENEANILKNKSKILAKSSKNQSLSIEQTTKFVTNISTNIKSNNKSVTKMLELGNIVKDATQKGEQEASKTLLSMDDIDSSTEEVNEAIKVISQIAFQTNILSLNAAVEAATAGEAGKGFAVVAQEVRNLANRSADAATQISALMNSLKNKSKNGKDIASIMVEDYQKLASNINETVNLIDGISTSTKEQNISISEVENSLNNIDKIVVENSSISEDINKVSKEIHSVASKILESSSKARFKGKENISIENSRN
ncbi:MAG: methyl-accepting chemotaxis protein [Campylobacterota bacterium]|nr:methyl-accepting chemotaxis protein [Campylobacterota bacterium]